MANDLDTATTATIIEIKSRLRDWQKTGPEKITEHGKRINADSSGIDLAVAVMNVFFEGIQTLLDGMLQESLDA